MARYTASMPLLPSALPPKGEARRYVANDFLNLIALPRGARCFPFPASLTVSPDRERKRFLAALEMTIRGKSLAIGKVALFLLPLEGGGAQRRRLASPGGAMLLS